MNFLKRRQQAHKRLKYDEYQCRRRENFAYLNTITKENGVVFVGDSIMEIYPTDEFFNTKIINRGISGDVAYLLINRIKADVIDIKPKLVIFQIGTNDIGCCNTIEETTASVKTILTMLKTALPKTKIVVLPVYPTVNQLTRGNDTIDKLNANYKAITTELDITFDDFSAKLKTAGGKAEASFFYDGLHPNIKGFALITEQLKKYV
ncbi:MAG: GDSL-type esterase/lipase family protein, partial [Clostridia bacterium]